MEGARGERGGVGSKCWALLPVAAQGVGAGVPGRSSAVRVLPPGLTFSCLHTFHFLHADCVWASVSVSEGTRWYFPCIRCGVAQRTKIPPALQRGHLRMALKTYPGQGGKWPGLHVAPDTCTWWAPPVPGPLGVVT